MKPNLDGRSIKRQATRKAIVFGAMSAGLYALVFTHADFFASLFAKGGFHTLLPVATVFLFSYVHGTLASNVWTALGINASVRVSQKKRVDRRAPAREEAPRPRPRASVET